MPRLSLPKNRNFWYSFALFAFVILTGLLLLLNWDEASRIEIFRGVIQMALFTFWGFDRYSKYRAQMTEAERPEDNEASA